MSLTEDSVAWAVLESSPDGIAICDDAGHMVIVNRQMEVLFGYQRSELLGRPVELLVPAEVTGRPRPPTPAYVAAPRTRPMGSGLRLHGVRADGSRFPIEIALSPVRTDAGQLIVAAVRDVSARLEIETELRRRRSRRCSPRTASASPATCTTRSSNGSSPTGSRSRRCSRRSPTTCRQRLQTVLDDHDDAIREIRTTILGLGRSRAGESGLRRAILDVVDQAARILGFRPTVRLDGVLESRLGDQIEGELLATLREALSNAARHAQATWIEVEVRPGAAALTLSVPDNGRASTRASSGSGTGWRTCGPGRTSWAAAASSTPPTGGTAVEWVVPLL